MGDPYRSMCPECDVLRQTILAQKASHEEAEKDLRERNARLSERLAETKRDVWRGRLPWIIGVAVLAFLGWHLHHLLLAPEPACRDMIEVIDHQNSARHCDRGATLDVHPIGDSDKVVVSCTCPREAAPAASVRPR